MIWFNLFSSRKEKEKLLKEIIKNLRISTSEKDIYNLCIEVLDDTWFDEFFKKITKQIETNRDTIVQHSTIAPLTSTLI